MSERPLRDDLAALRLDRSAAPGRRKGPRIAAALAALLLVVGLFYGAWRSPPSVTVAEAHAVSAAEAPPPEILSGSGYVVTGDRYVSIGANVAGRIERYLVEEGDSVRRGDPLVELDAREYHANVARLEAGIESAKATHTLTAAELRRGRQLYADGILAAQEVEALDSREQVARARIAELDAELAQARVRLEYTTLRAPADGVVLAKLKEAGEIAVPGGFAGSGDLVRLANLGDLRAEVDVNEADLARVRLGQAATVVPDSRPQARYAAIVAKLYPQVDRQKGTLKVEARILEPDRDLLPDMSVRVTFLGEPQSDAEKIVLVPAGALQHDADGSAYVWTVESKTARKRLVTADGTAGEQARIAGGLESGTLVVLSSSRPLENGERVEVGITTDD